MLLMYHSDTPGNDNEYRSIQGLEWIFWPTKIKLMVDVCQSPEIINFES